MFASGDGGVSGGQSQDCTTFVPVFPGTCPLYVHLCLTPFLTMIESNSVTSVGGTQGVSPEIAASLSSGGFSNYFARPSYQANAVSSYLKGLGNTNAGLFNKTSRAFPDIAAPAENVVIALSGQFGLVAGTSCASPIFASVIALINDQLITAGKKPLGFLNPFIYKNPGAFHDITSGAFTQHVATFDAHPHHTLSRRRQPRLQHQRIPCKGWLGPCTSPTLVLILLRLTLKSPGDGLWIAQFRRVEKGGGLVTDGACVRVRYDFFDVRCYRTPVALRVKGQPRTWVIWYINGFSWELCNPLYVNVLSYHSRIEHRTRG